MIQIPYEDIVAKIKAATQLTDTEIQTKVQEKLDSLSGLISKEGAAHIIANELNVHVFPEQGGTLKIKDLHPGMRNITTVGKITRKYDIREFNSNNRSGKVGSILLADEERMIRVTFWNDQADKLNEYKEGDVLKISNAYTRENNGRAEIHINDNSTLDLNPAGITITAKKAPAKAERKTIKELSNSENNAEVLATIVQVYDPNFFEPKNAPGTKSYVMNLFLDDGTDNIRAVLWKDSTNSLLGKTEADMIKYEEDKSQFEGIKTELLGQMVLASGRTQHNEGFGRTEFVVNSIKKASPEDAGGKTEAKEEPKTEETPKEQPKQETPAETKPKESLPEDLELDEELVSFDDL